MAEARQPQQGGRTAVQRIAQHEVIDGAHGELGIEDGELRELRPAARLFSDQCLDVPCRKEHGAGRPRGMGPDGMGFAHIGHLAEPCARLQDVRHAGTKLRHDEGDGDGAGKKSENSRRLISGMKQRITRFQNLDAGLAQHNLREGGLAEAEPTHHHQKSRIVSRYPVHDGRIWRPWGR